MAAPATAAWQAPQAPNFKAETRDCSEEPVEPDHAVSSALVLLVGAPLLSARSALPLTLSLTVGAGQEVSAPGIPRRREPRARSKKKAPVAPAVTSLLVPIAGGSRQGGSSSARVAPTE
jgi:hypothetical protein